LGPAYRGTALRYFFLSCFPFTMEARTWCKPAAIHMPPYKAVFKWYSMLQEHCSS
jgi:hypothetical protein